MPVTQERSECCEECGCTLRDNIGKICPSCDAEYYVYCSVCKKHQLEDDGCAHVTLTGDGYAGCGSTDLDAEDHADSFFALLDMIGKEKAIELRELLRKHEYDLREAFDRCRYTIGDTFLGATWLLSLEVGFTKKADRKTVSWITEWLKIGRPYADSARGDQAADTQP